MTTVNHAPQQAAVAAQDVPSGNCHATVARRPGDAVTSTMGDGFELRFESLFVEGRSLSFPCDAQGRVDVASLAPRVRDNYLRAQALLGREFSTPAVRYTDLH
jgi:hypothetical protein